jgi:hypothetical protein
VLRQVDTHEAVFDLRIADLDQRQAFGNDCGKTAIAAVDLGCLANGCLK